MADLALASIAYNAPRAVAEQIRLLDKYLKDDYVLWVIDQSSDEHLAEETRQATVPAGCVYVRLPTRLHHEGLNYASALILGWLDKLARPGDDAPYLGFLDHDVYPTKPTRLIPLIEEAGFYGVGQRHAPTGRFYLWPGFCFFSREWLAGRPLDFTGIRGKTRADDGDTGSGLWPLFADEEWERLYRPEHGYRAIREPDDYGLQSWGYERIGDWVHLSNASHWMAVPEPDERDRLLYEMLAAL